jgi:hypothetical protein
MKGKPAVSFHNVLPFRFQCKRMRYLSLCVINQEPCHYDVWGNTSIAPPFLPLALDEGEWSASRLCRFIPGGRAPGTPWIRGRRRSGTQSRTVRCGVKRESKAIAVTGRGGP